MVAETFARPYFVTPHACRRWRERVDPTATAAQAIRDIQAALQGPTEDAPGADGCILRRRLWQGRPVILVVDPHPPGRSVAGETWPAVVTVGGMSHYRAWLRYRQQRTRTTPRRWTEDEELFAANHLTLWTPAAIARALGRTEKAVRHWCWRRRQSPTRQDLITSGEAARLTGLTPQALTAAARAGRIPARRVPGGRWWLFDPETLRAYRRVR